MTRYNVLLALLLGVTVFFASCSDDSEPGSTLTQQQQDSIAVKAAADTELAAAFATDNNTFGDPGIAVTGTATAIVPTGTVNNAQTLTGSFFDAAAYQGGVDPNAATPWYATDTWSYYAHLIQGVPDKVRTQGAIADTIDAAEMDGLGTTVNWTANTTYYLDGFVFVNDGQTLNIEAGTVIKGLPGQTTDASALIVARGGTINANGTAAAPIIMTYAADELDGTDNTGAADVTGQWGGLIVLGNAGLNSTPGTTPIEGIPTAETRGVYGGSDDADNSGTIRYVSIRHGGTDIGAGNEINGFTLGGVGSGTTIEFVEVIANEDDGWEWFGGTANAKWIIAAFCRDDSFDYDEGYRGNNQFCIVHQNPGSGFADRGGEHDGGTDPENGTPFATPTFANVTSIGNPADRALTFRDNAGGTYVNSIFMNYSRGIDIEAFSDGSQSSFLQFQNNNLNIENCLFFNIGAGSTAADVLVSTVVIR